MNKKDFPIDQIIIKTLELGSLFYDTNNFEDSVKLYELTIKSLFNKKLIKISIDNINLNEEACKLNISFKNINHKKTSVYNNILNNLLFDNQFEIVSDKKGKKDNNKKTKNTDLLEKHEEKSYINDLINQQVLGLKNIGELYQEPNKRLWLKLENELIKYGYKFPKFVYKIEIDKENEFVTKNLYPRYDITNITAFYLIQTSINKIKVKFRYYCLINNTNQYIDPMEELTILTIEEINKKA